MPGLEIADAAEKGPSLRTWARRTAAGLRRERGRRDSDTSL